MFSMQLSPNSCFRLYTCDYILCLHLPLSFGKLTCCIKTGSPCLTSFHWWQCVTNCIVIGCTGSYDVLPWQRVRIYGAGAALDLSHGTKLNCDRGVLATHPEMHAVLVKHIFRNICYEAHMQWVQAIIDSGVATSSALQLASDNYEAGNYHEFVQQLCKASKPKLKLPVKCAQYVLSILNKGLAAVKLAVSQQSVSSVEIEWLLQLSPEAASSLTAMSLGSKDDSTCRELTQGSSSSDEDS